MKHAALYLMAGVFLAGPSLAQTGVGANTTMPTDGAADGTINAGAGPAGVDSNTGIQGSVVGSGVTSGSDTRIGDVQENNVMIPTPTAPAPTVDALTTPQQMTLSSDSQLVGRSVSGTGGANLGVVEAVRTDINGNSEVVLRTPNGKLVSVGRGLVVAGSANAGLMAETISATDLADMPAVDLSVQPGTTMGAGATTSY